MQKKKREGNSSHRRKNGEGLKKGKNGDGSLRENRQHRQRKGKRDQRIESVGGLNWKQK